MKITTLEGLLIDELQDIYNAENQIIKALPNLAEAAESVDLRSAFRADSEQTEQHVQRIEQICKLLDIEPKGKKCVGMEGLITESMELLNTEIEPDLLDAALIGIAQRIKHYKIAAYGTTRAHARQLGFINVANLLDQTLEDEKKTDHHLTELAENRVNVEAAMGHHISMI